MPTDDRPPESPPEPPEENGRFKVLDVRFWLALAFLVVCIVAAAVVAFFGPKIWPPKAPSHPAPAAAQARTDADTAALKARIAELEHELDAARQASAALSAPSQTAAPALAARLDRLEDAQKRTARAAAAAVAAGALADAAETSRPFVGELAALERLTPQNDLLTGLTPLAETGAPTRAALAAGFPEVATRAAAALHAPPKGSSALARVLAALGRLVTIRRIDDVTGTTPDAALARAERALSDGDLKGALAEVETLPPSARDAVAEWRQGARRRLDIEKRIEALRARALRDLAADPGAIAYEGVLIPLPARGERLGEGPIRQGGVPMIFRAARRPAAASLRRSSRRSPLAIAYGPLRGPSLITPSPALSPPSGERREIPA